MFLSVSLALSCPDVIKDCYFEFTSSSACSCFLPRVCTVTEDQTNNTKWHPFTSFCFPFLKVICFVSVCFVSRGKEVATRPSALARVKSAWEFGGIAASPMAARFCPVHRLWLSQARRSLVCQDSGRSRRRPRLTPSPPARL